MASVLIEYWLLEEGARQASTEDWQPELIGIFRNPQVGGIYRRHTQPTWVRSQAQLVNVTFNATTTVTAALSETADHLRTLADSATITPALSRVATDYTALAGSIVLSPTMAQLGEYSRSLAGSLALTGNVSDLSKYQRSLSGSLVLTSAESHWALLHLSMNLGITLTGAQSISNEFYCSLSGLISFSLAKSLVTYKTLAGDISVVLSSEQLSKYNKTLGASLVLGPAMSDVSAQFKSLVGSLLISSAMERSVTKQISTALQVNPALRELVFYSLSLNLAMDTAVTVARLNQESLDSSTTIIAEISEVQTQLFEILLDGTFEFVTTLTTELILGPPVPVPGGGGPGGRVVHRKPSEGRRQPKKQPLEAQAERILQQGLPRYYPVGAQKAWANMQQFYGSSDGRRVFIKKALEQGHGQTLRDKIADVYATGTTVDQRKKLKTQVTMRGQRGPVVKILSNRSGARKG